jgi:hypothetical protein
MAKSKRDKDLVERLRASGIRRKTAELMADATDRRRKPTKRVQSAVREMSKMISDVQDQISGGPAKRKAAAKKAAQTRKANAAKRSAAAKKAARTRAKSRA